MKMLRKFLQCNTVIFSQGHFLILPRKDHVDSDHFLVSVGVEVRHLLPLVNDVLTKVLWTLVNQILRIKASEDVVCP